MKNTSYGVILTIGIALILIEIISLISVSLYNAYQGDHQFNVSLASLLLCIIVALLTFAIVVLLLRKLVKQGRRLSSQECESVSDSSDLFRDILDTLPHHIYSKDRQGRFIFGNKRFCDTNQLSYGELIGQTDTALASPELVEQYHKDDLQAIETQRCVEYLEKRLSVQGEKILTQIIKTPLYTVEHECIGVVGIYWDIMVPAGYDASSPQNQERYRNFMENAPLGILSIDNEGCIIDMNPMFVAMLGSPSEQATRTLNMLTSSSLIESGIAEDFRQCLEFGLPHISERYCQTKWGKQVYLRSHLMPIRNAESTVIGVQAIIEDNTESKLAEMALHESEAEYHSLFKNMLSGLAYHKILVDEYNKPLDFVFLEINDAFERLLGLTKDIIGKRATEVIPEIKNLQPDLIDIYGNVALTGKEVTFDFYFEPFGVWYSVAAYSPEMGYFIALYDDITERKWAEESLRRMNEDLEQRVEARTIELKDSNQALQESLQTLERAQEQLVQSEKMAALGALVAGVAHEINTPLGIGVTAASLLAEKSQEIERLYQQNQMKRSHLEKYIKLAIESSTMILGNLRRASENIQSFKLVAVDQTSDEKRSFRLNEYINDVLLSLYPKLKRTRHSISIDCPNDLELNSYPGAFSQIITNFVLNSLMHGFENHHKPGKIEIEVQEKENSLIIRYSDNGKGIAEQERSHIFEPFFTTKRGQGGSGLGLHIVYNLVTQRLNGNIRCESIPGVGTIFIIQIPV